MKLSVRHETGGVEGGGGREIGSCDSQIVDE